MDIGSTMGSSFTAGTQTIHQGIAQATRAAQEVVDSTTARPVEQTSRLHETMVNLRQSEHLVAAGGKIVQAADQQLGTLIDIKA